MTTWLIPTRQAETITWTVVRSLLEFTPSFKFMIYFAYFPLSAVCFEEVMQSLRRKLRPPQWQIKLLWWNTHAFQSRINVILLICTNKFPLCYRRYKGMIMGGGLNSFFFFFPSCWNTVFHCSGGCIPKQMLSMIVCLFYHKCRALSARTAFWWQVQQRCKVNKSS